MKWEDGFNLWHSFCFISFFFNRSLLQIGLSMILWVVALRRKRELLAPRLAHNLGVYFSDFPARAWKFGNPWKSMVFGNSINFPWKCIDFWRIFMIFSTSLSRLWNLRFIPQSYVRASWYPWPCQLVFARWGTSMYRLYLSALAFATFRVATIATGISWPLLW